MRAGVPFTVEEPSGNAFLGVPTEPGRSPGGTRLFSPGVASPLTEADPDLAVLHAPYRFSPAAREDHDAP